MAATPEHAARVLGLSLGASLDDVRRVRRKMALKYHPDRYHDKEQATRHMARINAATDTLTAHIKKRVRTQAKGKSPSYTDFSKPKQADQSSVRFEKPKPQTASRTKEKKAQTTRKPERPKTKSRADIALVRFATESYANVLDRIGKKDSGPRIDISILSFQCAH